MCNGAGNLNGLLSGRIMAEYVNVAKAARILGISRSRMQELIKTGELQTFEGQVEMQELRNKFPGLAFNESPIVERTKIIKDTAFGERIQKLVEPPSDVLKAKIRRLSVDLNVERTRARDYQGVIEDLLEKLSEMQEFSNESQRRIIHELNIWLLARFESTKE
jgi:CDP-4-dehydro-6-deoxyglucose reductase